MLLKKIEPHAPSRGAQAGRLGPGQPSESQATNPQASARARGAKPRRSSRTSFMRTSQTPLQSSPGRGSLLRKSRATFRAGARWRVRARPARWGRGSRGRWRRSCAGARRGVRRSGRWPPLPPPGRDRALRGARPRRRTPAGSCHRGARSPIRECCLTRQGSSPHRSPRPHTQASP